NAARRNSHDRALPTIAPCPETPRVGVGSLLALGRVFHFRPRPSAGPSLGSLVISRYQKNLGGPENAHGRGRYRSPFKFPLRLEPDSWFRVEVRALLRRAPGSTCPAPLSQRAGEPGPGFS